MKIKLILLLAVILTSCSPWPEEFALEETDPNVLLSLADRSQDPEIRARWLFLAAGNAWKMSQADTPHPKNDLIQLARGALMRILELGTGPQEAARHNLSIILAREPEGLLPSDDTPPDVLDLSRNIRHRPEEVKKLEQQLSKEIRPVIPVLSTTAPEEDW